MLRGSKNQFSLTRAALSTFSAQKQLPINNNYGVNLRAADLGPIKSAGDLWRLVQSRKRV